MGKSIGKNNGDENGFDFDAAFQEAAGNGTLIIGKTKKDGDDQRKKSTAKKDDGFDFDSAFDQALKKKESKSVSEDIVTPSPTGTESTPPLVSPSELVGKESIDLVKPASPLDYKRQIPKTASMPSDLLKAIDHVRRKVFYGNIKPEELDALYNKSDDGKAVVENIVKQAFPGLPDVSISDPVLLSAASKKINVTNRKNFYNAERQGVLSLDNSIKETAVDYNKDLPANKAGRMTPYINELRKGVTIENPDNDDQISAAIQKVKKIDALEQKYFLTEKERKESRDQAQSLITSLKDRLYYNISRRGVTPTLNQLHKQVDHAVVSKIMESERGEKSARSESQDNTKISQFKLGLTAIEKIDPILFNLVLNAIVFEKKIADSDFSTIAQIGQQIDNSMRFRGGAYNPALIDTETNFDYSTFGQKKSMAALKIGEWAKNKGYKNMAEFPERIIRQGAKEVGEDNQEIVNSLVLDEKLLMYDAIPKSGWIDDIASGGMEPLSGINSTLNSWSESPSQTYLRSKSLESDIGGQKVPNEKGEVSSVLPSERGRFTTDMFRGLGQFIPQVLLTKGVGTGLKGVTKLAGVTLPAYQARNVTDLGGTMISTFLQSFGPSYEEHLQKTGNANEAALIGTIDGVITGGFETFILPDVRLAGKAFAGLKKGLSGDLLTLIKKGGDPAELAAKARPFVLKFATNAGDILVKENLEELGTQYADFVVETIFDPASAKERNLNKELWDVFKSTTAAMILPAIAGAGGSSLQKDFTTRSLHNAAINFDSYKESLQKSLDKGYMSQNDFNSSVKILSTHKESIDYAPTINANGVKLSPQQKLDYALEETKIKVYKDKSNNTSGIAKKMWDDNIAKAEEVQKQIVFPEPIEENKGEVQVKEEVKIAEKATEEELKAAVGEEKSADAVNFVNEMIEGGVIGEGFQGMAKNPLTFLRFAAQQGTGASKAAAGQLTKTVIEYAQTLFPNTKPITDASSKESSKESGEKESREKSFTPKSGAKSPVQKNVTEDTEGAAVETVAPSVQSKKSTITEEVDREIENTKAAIESAKMDDDFQFEGVSIKQLNEDLEILQSNPKKYFARRINELMEDSSNVDVNSKERRQTMDLINKYQDIWDGLTGNKEKVGDVFEVEITQPISKEGSESTAKNKSVSFVEKLFGVAKDRESKREEGVVFKTKVVSKVSSDGEVITTLAVGEVEENGIVNNERSVSTNSNWVDVNEFNSAIEPHIEKNPKLGYGSTNTWLTWNEMLTEENPPEKVQFKELREPTEQNTNKSSFIEVIVQFEDGVRGGFLFAVKPLKSGSSILGKEQTKPIKNETTKEGAGISEDIVNEREKLERSIKGEESFLEKTRPNVLGRVADKLVGVKRDRFLNNEKQELALLNKDPVEYFKKRLRDEKEEKAEGHIDLLNEFLIKKYEDIVSRIEKSNEQATKEGAKPAEPVSAKKEEPATPTTAEKVKPAEETKAATTKGRPEVASKIRNLKVAEEPAAEKEPVAEKPAEVIPEEKPTTTAEPIEVTEPEVIKKPEPKKENPPKEKKEVKEKARKIRDENIKKEIDSAWDEFLKGDNTLTAGGLDPKKIEAGTKLIALYIKGGVYKFADILEDAYAKFGDKLSDFVDALKAVYSTYYNTEATDEQAELMDASVRNITLQSVINRIEDGKPAAKVEEIPTTIPVSTPRQFVDAVKVKLKNGEKLNIIALRKLAAERGISVKDTELQEMTELAIVEMAREISLSNQPTQERFNGVVDLYNSQPTISMRSSERIDKAQYSTPIPISFLMGDFVNKNNPEIVLEPNAGNGMLTIAIPPNKIISNEIDPVRLKMLAEQGFGMVTNQDATEKFPGQYGGIVMNPPFGSKAAVNFDGIEIKGLDEQMVANALTSLHPNGRAAIIIGGHNRYDEKGRLAADRVFLNYLYNRYNVVDIINIDGDLWSKQGTSFSTRVILIDGVKAQKSGVAPLYDQQVNEPVKDFDELFTRIQNAKQNENIIPASSVQPVLDADTDTGNVISGGVQTPGKNQRTTPQPDTNQDKLLSATKSESQRETPSNDRGLAANIPGVNDTGIRQPDQSNIADRVLGESEAKIPETQQQPPTTQQGRSDTDIQRNEPVSISDRAGNILNEKVKYRPKSKAKSVDTVIPTQMASETDHTLDAIEKIYGDIDTFVAKELEYSKIADLHKAFSAEQVDALAIAIHQLKTGQGMIIGDMTGVGKGRIAAGVVRYAVINGFKPMFLTEKPNLFSDLYRDMVAIGSDKLVPFVVNDKNPDNDPDIKDQDGNVVHKSFGGNRKKAILNAGIIPKDFDYTVSTYSQFRTAMDKASLKRDFFLNNTQGNILIMDESHNASGESNAGELFQNVLPNTSGVIFLSATFAKRPDNMPVYAMKTAMADANMSREELVAAIKKGGVALQEVVAANLVQSGQMIRRERDFTGVKIDYNVLEDFKDEHRKVADGITTVVRDIIKFEGRYVNPIINEMDSELAAQQSTAEKRKGTKSMGVSNHPFVNKTFNLINQLLFSIKAKQIAQAAIKAHKEGKKPVIGFLSTMESFLNHMGITVGEKLDKADFALVLKRGLEGTMRYSVRDAEGNTIPGSLSLSELSPEGQRQYRKLLEDIREITSGIHISPIDIMIKELKDAGLRVGEITGRSKYLEIQNDGSSIVKERVEKDINTIARKFNSGEIDVILLNASGATGISLHASQDFKDQRPRVLISGQLELDINKEVQKRGRIDRTGQIHRGEFQYVVSSIPAEQRLLMMFKAKLKSLDANTTSSQKSKSNQLDVVDFLNKYGDEIVTQYVKENTDFNEKIQDPFDFADKSDEDLSEIKKIENAASRVTGRVAILSTNEQEQFYSEIVEAYKSFITHLDDNKENDLEVNLLPLNATTKERTEVISGRGTDSPFGMPSIREKVEVDVLTKPMKKEEIDVEVAKYLDGKERNAVRDKLLGELSAYEETFIDDKTQKIEEHYQNEVIPETIARLEKKKDVTQDEIESKRNELDEARGKRIERERLKYQNIFGSVENSMRTFTPGAVYSIPVSTRVDTNTFFSKGIFLGFQIKEGSVNKYTPSNIIIRFAVNDSRRIVNIPLSKTDYVNSIIANSRYGDDRGTVLKEWDSRISNKTRTTRYIITGNLLQAYGTNDGQLASFTTEGGAIRKGMILPDSYEADKQKFRTTLSRAFTDDVNRVVSSDGDVVVERERGGGYSISVPLSRKLGGKYFLDETLRSFVANNDFVQRGGRMTGFVNENNIRPLLLALDAMGVTSESGIPKAGRPVQSEGETKSLADSIREAKIKLGGLQSNIAGLPIAIYNAAIETIALAVEGGVSLTNAIKKAIADHQLEKQRNFDRGEFISVLEAATGETYIEDTAAEQEETETENTQTEDTSDQPPTGQPPVVDTEEEGERFDDKAIIARMIRSKKVSEETKEILEPNKKYKIRTQKEARRIANEVISEFGSSNALVMAESGKFHGDVNSMIFALSLDDIYTEEESAQSPAEKQRQAERYADVALRYQDAAESGGRFISAIYDFYKKSPAGLILKTEKEFKRRRDEYFKGREQTTKEAWKEFLDTVEGKEMLEEEIAGRKKERKKIFTPETETKIKAFFSKLKVDTKKNTGVYLIPPQIYNAAIDIIETAVLGGVSIGKAIERAVDYIGENYKGTWQVKEFKKDIRDGFRKQNVQKVLSAADRESILKKWSKRLIGLNQDQKNELLNRAFLELVDNGALNYEHFKELYAEALGLPFMTPELADKLKDLAVKINLPNKIKDEIIKSQSTALVDQYMDAVKDAEIAATKLNDLIGKQKWWLNTFLTVMRLNTLGAVSLVGNIAYNVAALPVRFAVNLTATGLDYLLSGVQLTSDKLFGTDLSSRQPTHNVFRIQKGFVRGFAIGSATAAKQFFTGLSNRDYFQKEIRQNIKPLTSAKKFIRGMTGKQKVSLNEMMNSFIEAFPTMGMSAEVIARALNLGDKGFRYAAEFAKAEQLAQQKGLTGVEKEIFILFPDEESENKIREAGEKIVFQQRNIVTKAMDNAGKAISDAVKKGGPEAKALHGIGKTIGYAMQPFLNTPLNVFNEFIHYAFPPLPLYKAAKAMVSRDSEKAIYHLSQAIVGMSIGYAATQLVAQGLIVGTGDDDEAKERLGIQTYQRHGQINVSGLKRLLAGNYTGPEDGDVWKDLKYYGFIGMMLLTKARQYGSSTKEEIQQQTYVQDLVGQFVPAVKTGLADGVFSGTGTLMNAISMGGGYTDQWLLGMTNVFTNAFEPNWLRSLSLANNDYFRDTKGMTLAESAKNQLKQRFFMGDELPAKINIWGEKMESTPPGSNKYLYNVMGLSKKNIFDNDKFGYALYDYYNQTKNYNVFPPVLKREVNGKKLTPQQYEQFSILVGSHRRQLVAPLIESGEFETLKAEGKAIDRLEKIYGKARDLGVTEFSNIYPEFQKKKKEE